MKVKTHLQKTHEQTSKLFVRMHSNETLLLLKAIQAIGSKIDNLHEVIVNMNDSIDDMQREGITLNLSNLAPDSDAESEASVNTV